MSVWNPTHAQFTGKFPYISIYYITIIYTRSGGLLLQHPLMLLAQCCWNFIHSIIFVPPCHLWHDILITFSLWLAVTYSCLKTRNNVWCGARNDVVVVEHNTSLACPQCIVVCLKSPALTLHLDEFSEGLPHTVTVVFSHLHSTLNKPCLWAICPIAISIVIGLSNQFEWNWKRACSMGFMSGSLRNYVKHELCKCYHCQQVLMSWLQLDMYGITGWLSW